MTLVHSQFVMFRCHAAFVCWLIFWGLPLPGLAAVASKGQQRSRDRDQIALTTAAPADANGESHLVEGRVIDVVTGLPLPRALVRLNSRAVLTDGQGRFRFPGFTAVDGYASAAKPGYSADPDGDVLRQQKVENLDKPLELRLYRDVLVLGVVAGLDGLPLARTPIVLQRLSFDVNGGRWVQAAFTLTNARGEYRFEQPAGRFRVSSNYVSRSVERGLAVLPAVFPAGLSGQESGFELRPGQQQVVDLRPRTGPTKTISVTVDGSENERGMRLSAVTASGVRLQPAFRKTDNGFTGQLPAGTYTLHVDVDNRETPMTGETRVVVGSDTSMAAVVHLLPKTLIPVEIIVEGDPAAAPPIAPTLQQANLFLRPQSSLIDNGDIRLNVRNGQTPGFRVDAGRYRLIGGPLGAWFVRSATFGSSDLMTQDLVAGPGQSGGPIRIVLSNRVGKLKGMVTSAGQPASGWVYLLPEQPSLSTVFQAAVQGDGSYAWSGPAGRYTAFAVEQQVHRDFRDPQLLKNFGSSARTVEVLPGTETTANLDRIADDGGVH